MPELNRPSAPYLQIADYYREQIGSGALAVGDPFPSTREIARTWEVAGATAQRVFWVLKAEGLIETSNRGTFVAGH